ncbi:hypothetical protein [Streptomyces sp. ok210]|jgi:hypothetical protein|nr:hypothetical protein [Streptomyces sp. ok210]SFT20747.1 hypothetical protein SAMN04487982_1103 [Streptomyces sp. ok210]
MRLTNEYVVPGTALERLALERAAENGRPVRPGSDDTRRPICIYTAD